MSTTNSLVPLVQYIFVLFSQLNSTFCSFPSRVYRDASSSSWLEPKSLSWAGSAWLSDIVKIQVWLAACSKEFGISKLSSAWALNKVRFMRLGLGSKLSWISELSLALARKKVGFHISDWLWLGHKLGSQLSSSLG